MMEFLIKVRDTAARYSLLLVLALVLTLIVLFAETVVLIVGSIPSNTAPPKTQVTAAPPKNTTAPLVTADQMRRLSYHDSLMGELQWKLSRSDLSELNRVLRQYDITTPEQISQFLAQATVESAAGHRLTESGDEAYFQSRGYTTGTRGAGYIQLTFEYGQMAFSTWMIKQYVPELSEITYVSPATHGKEEIATVYYQALKAAADRGIDVSRYSRIVYSANSALTTGADYIAEAFAWESAGYYWSMAGINAAFQDQPGVENTDIASALVGGEHWQSRREAYLAFYPVLVG